jgi:hypothetical protein
MKRKILVSLFAITAIIGGGVFATGAYFTDTITQDNYTFTTGSADIKLAFCGPVGTACGGNNAFVDSVNFVSPDDDFITGPGKSGVDCIVIKNAGQYSVTLSTQLSITSYSNAGMRTAFQVAAENASENCFTLGTFLRPWKTVLDASVEGRVVSNIVLAPGARAYVLTENRWDSTDPQNNLAGGFIKLQTVIEGRTV